MSRKPKNSEIPSEPRRSQLHRGLAVCGFLLLAVWLVFRPTLDYGFVNFDDDVYVYNNPELSQGLSIQGIRWAFTTNRGGQWAPMTWLSYLTDYQIYGLKPWGYHLTNLLLHAATTVLLFLVLWRMTGEIWPSAFVAAVFAIHPLQVESVVWVTERKGLLSGLFFVLTLGAYLCYVRRPFSIGRYAAVAVFFALGLMAKPTLVALPFVLLLLDYWPLGRISHNVGQAADRVPLLRRSSAGRDSLSGTACKQAVAHSSEERGPGRMIVGRLRPLLVEKSPLLLIAAGSCAIAPWAQGTAVISLEKLPMDARVSNALASSVAYLGKFFWPMDLAVFYPHPLSALPVWKSAAALLVLLVITAAVLIRWRRSPYLFVGWFWYLGMLVPVIGVVQIGLHAMADRYMYLPQIGLSIAVTWAAPYVVRSWSYRVWACGAAASLAIVALIVCASQQTTHWRDSEALWTRAIACTSQNNRAHSNLGGELFKQKRFPEAIEHFKAALEIEPEDTVSHCGLGDALLGLARETKAVEPCEEAVAHYTEALRIEPGRADVRSNLGNALVALRRFDEAIAQYEAALKIEPDRTDIRHNLDVARSLREKAKQ